MVKKLPQQYKKAQKNNIKLAMQYVAEAAFMAIIGFSVPLLAVWLWLYHIDAIPYFVELFTKYLPLHLHITHNLEILEGLERQIYLVRAFVHYSSKYIGIWLIPASYCVYAIFTEKEVSGGKKRWLSMLVVLAVVGMALIYVDTFKADDACIEKFGEDYVRYMQRVPRVNFVTGLLRKLLHQRERHESVIKSISDFCC